MIKHFTGRLLATFLFLALFTLSCETNDPLPEVPTGSTGYFIVNEGAFGAGNASLSFYDRTTKSVTNNVFLAANKIPLGDQAQSMTVHDDRGFVVVQNSAKIEVINQDEYTIISTITDGIVSPRYFVGLSPSKGYVSDWGADGGITGTVKVIDLVSYEVTKTIPTGQGTNRLLISGTNLYAVNAGGQGRDKTIKVIDTNTDEITQSITVTDNPNSLQLASDGNIWIATSGYKKYDLTNYEVVEEQSTSGALVKLGADGIELMRLPFEGLSGPENLNVNAAGTELYYTYSGAVYSMSTSSTSLPTSTFIDKNFYGLAIDPIDDKIIGCEAPNFSSAGNVLIYSPKGILATTLVVGIGPNSCTFK